MTRRTHSQAATTSAVSWTIFDADDFDLREITLTFGTAPTTAENLTVSLDSHLGAGYDSTLLTIDPIGCTSLVIKGPLGLKDGDKIVVAYTNTDGSSITGTATTEIHDRPREFDVDVTDPGALVAYKDGVIQQPASGIAGGDAAPCVTKAITFSNTTGAQTLFTVTGDVVVRVFCICKTNVASAGGCNAEVGISGATSAIIATTDATLLAANEIWHDATPDAAIEAESVLKSFIISNGADIILTPSAQLDSGALTFYCRWVKLSSNGNVVAA